MSLIPAGFEQQGTVNWDNLALRSVNLSMDILSRCTAAGVDPGTLVFGHVISRNFPLSVKGQRNIGGALHSLPLKSSYDKMLWFGFGIKSLARKLGESSEGCSLFAICATLGECFHEEYAAEVLHHLVLCNKAPAEHTPSIHQWLMVIRACNGALSTTDFSVKADSFIRLQGLRGKAGKVLSGSQCPVPEDLAKVLHGVGEVVSGAVDSIHIVGCSATGWVAAFVDWLFNLRLSVQDHEGSVWYSNFEELKQAHVTIQFDRNNPTQQLQLASKTCLLKDATDFLKCTATDDMHVVTGRLPRDSCLETAFGARFMRKMKAYPELVGRCLSWAAYLIYDPRSVSSPPRPHPWLPSPMPGRTPNDVTAAIFLYFRELRPAARFAEVPPHSFWAAQSEHWEDLVASIELACRCEVCDKQPRKRSMHSLFTAALTCFARSLAVIVRCGVALVCVESPSSLLPTRIGLQSALEEGCSLQRIAHDDGTDGPLAEIPYWFGLFSGRRPTDNNLHLESARHFGGLCIFRKVLQQLSTMDGEMQEETMFSFNAVPGHIEYFNRTHLVLEDSTTREYSAQPTSLVAMNVNTLPWTGYLSVSLQETATSLLARYHIYAKQPHGQQPPTYVKFWPWALTERMLERKPGYLGAPCRREPGECFDYFQTMPRLEEVTHSGMTLNLNGRKTVLFTYQNITYMELAIVALIGFDCNNSRYSLADANCLSCCLKEAVESISPKKWDDHMVNVLRRHHRGLGTEVLPFLVRFVRVINQKRWDDQVQYLAHYIATHGASGVDAVTQG